jgi:hypothetical protein
LPLSSVSRKVWSLMARLFYETALTVEIENAFR